MNTKNDNLMLFETYASLQTKIGKHFRILIKGDNIINTPKYVPQFRNAIKKLTSSYKPHIIKHSNYWRWSFSIPLKKNDGYYTGVNLVIEWHKNNHVEYLTFKTKPKMWKNGHLPPCLWK